MARICVSLAVATGPTSGIAATSKRGHDNDPVAGSTYASTKATFETALAQLVTDGASPTQAHVTTANTAYTAFSATLAAPPANTDVVVSINNSNVTSMSVARQCLRQLETILMGDKAFSQ